MHMMNNVCKRVFYDDFKDLSNVEKCIEFPTWEDIEKVINLLDGEYVTQITMDTTMRWK